MTTGIEAEGRPLSPRDEILAFGERAFGAPYDPEAGWKLEENVCDLWQLAITDGERYFVILDSEGKGFRSVTFKDNWPFGMSARPFTEPEGDTPDNMIYFDYEGPGFVAPLPPELH